MIRMWEKNEKIKVGSGRVFVVLGAYLRVLTSINSCHFNAKFAWTSKLIVLVKVNFFGCSMQKRPLCSYQLFDFTFGHSQNFKEFFAYMWLEIGDSLHPPNTRWLLHPHLLSCSHLMNHTSILLIFHVTLIGQRSFWEDKTWHFLVHPFLQLL